MGATDISPYLAIALGRIGMNLVLGNRIVGRLAFLDELQSNHTWTTSCSKVTFNNRIDSRRHFITSAALQAASNRGFAVSLGEFKELYDSISGAGGFDFTDIAANLSGIALSDYMVGLQSKAWASALTRLTQENDIIVPFDGIPQIMSVASFEERFGDVDSPAYKKMVDQIENQITQLALFQAK